MALPTSTTNITGFFATMRGSSLRNASLMARLTMAPSNNARGAFFGRMVVCWAGVASSAATGSSSCFSMAMSVVPSMSRERLHLELFDDRSEREPGDVREGSDDDDDANEERSEGGCVGRKVPDDSGTCTFFASAPAIAKSGMIIKKRPMSIAKPMVTLYQGVLAVMPAKAEPLFPVPEAYV